MELSFLFLFLCAGSCSNEIIQDEQYQLPQFTWLDSNNILVLFPNGVQDTINLWPADKIGNMTVPCLFEGVLKADNSSSIAVSGCQHHDLVNIVMYSINLPDHTTFNIHNGTVEEVEKINFDKHNDGRKMKQRLRKRGAYLVDDAEDYDEIAFDGSDPPPPPPPLLSMKVKLGFEDSLLLEKKTEAAARDYIARVFTLGKQHLLHASLGTRIGLIAVGPIKRIRGKSWNPSEVDLKESIQNKDRDNIPITFFCYNQDRENNIGISYVRKACDEVKGAAIIAARRDINKAAQSYGHETGHWIGMLEDYEMSDECEGQGIMSSSRTPGGRPNRWSQCAKKKFNKWFRYGNRKFSKCLKEVSYMLELDRSNDVVTHLYRNGQKYVGELRNGQRHGKGILVWPSGEKYDGEWKNDKRNGKGINTWPSGQKYDGEWKNDKKHGKGIHTWPSGEKYDGEWKNDKKYGKGILILPSGEKYDGEWKHDKRNGKGINIWPSGEKHDGGWKNDKRHGKGICTWPSGWTSSGTWVNGVKESWWSWLG